jgi:hypothetical protein
VRVLGRQQELVVYGIEGRGLSAVVFAMRDGWEDYIGFDRRALRGQAVAAAKEERRIIGNSCESKLLEERARVEKRMAPGWEVWSFEVSAWQS